MNSIKFYESFSRTFDQEQVREMKEVHRLNDIRVSDTEWTNLISNVLKIVASEIGFSREKEVSVASGWIDEKWQNGEQSIFIEHENNGKVNSLMDQEVKSLLNSDGDLRILITYFDEKNLKKEAQLRSKILDKLKREKRGRDFEFLLIIGKYGMTSSDEYKAYLYRPTFELESVKINAEVN